MLQDIEGYVRTTGDEVVVADDPERGMLGFTTIESGRPPRWEISLLSIERLPSELRSRFTGGAEERARLAQDLSTPAFRGVASLQEATDLVTRWRERAGARALDARGARPVGAPRPGAGGTPGQHGRDRKSVV